MDKIESTTDTNKLLIFDSESFVEDVLGDPKLARGIAERALDDIQRNHDGIILAVEEADAQQLHFHAHALKGVTRLVRCEGLTRHARELELIARDQTLEKNKTKLTQLEPLVQSSLKALADFCQNH